MEQSLLKAEACPTTWNEFMIDHRILFSVLVFTVACDERPQTLDTSFDCSEIGCSDSFEADFQPVLEMQGDYLFTLDVDGVVTTCAMTLPLIDGQSCDGPLQLLRSGSALPESEHSLPAFSILETGFVSYTLTIELDGVELVRWTEEPEWDVIQPNGEGCAPVCEVASSMVVIP